MRWLSISVVLAAAACSVDVPNSQTGTFACSSDADCLSDFTCSSGQCVASTGTDGTTTSSTTGETTGAGATSGATTGGTPGTNTTTGGGTTSGATTTSGTTGSTAGSTSTTGGTAGGTTGSTAGGTTGSTTVGTTGSTTGSTTGGSGAPITSIAAQPPSYNNFQTVSVSFSCNDPSCSFQCTFDSTSAACTSPFTSPNLSDGSHQLTIQATYNGMVETNPPTVSWVTDRTPPTITVSHDNTTQVDSMAVDMTCNDASSCTYACTLDNQTVQSCSSSMTFNQLGGRIHVFAVTATDAAGNSAPTVTTAWAYVPDWLSAGATSSCAVTADGNGTCWGGNAGGQLGSGAPVDSDQHQPVAHTMPWVTLQTGGGIGASGHTCGIQSDGSLWCWGNNDDGQCGTGFNTPTPVSQVSNETQWAMISTGGSHTCGIKLNGSLWCWGNNDAGQLGLGVNNFTSTSVPTQVASQGATTWMKVSAGNTHTCAIDTDTRVWCWGDNSSAQLGTNVGGQSSLPSAPSSSTGWSDIAAGGQHTCGIWQQQLWCWGSNLYGQLGQAANLPMSTTELRANDGGVAWNSVAAGAYHTCGIDTSGNMHCVGSNAELQISNASTSTALYNFVQLAGANWVELSAGQYHTCATQIVNNLRNGYCWGATNQGQLTGTYGEMKSVSVAQGPAGFTSGGVPTLPSTLSAGGNVACVIDNSQMPWCWGDGTFMQQTMASYGSNQHPVQIDTHPWQSLRVGTRHSCGIHKDVVQGNHNNIFCWGNDDSGQTGQPANPKPQASPTAMGNPNNWTKVAVGGHHTCGIDFTGNIYCWGDNQYGQLGVDPVAQPNSNLPVHSPNDAATGWFDVVAGEHHTCGLWSPTAGATIGGVWCWGDNSRNQVGCAGQTSCASENHVFANPNLIELVAGDNFTCAVESPSGGAPTSSSILNLWCWGDNTYGQLGEDSPTSTAVPNKVVPGSGTAGWFIGGFGAGARHMCAVQAQAQNLWCWGDNAGSQLGFPSDQGLAQALPYEADGTQYWWGVQGGARHTCATWTAHAGDSNASITCWGDNDTGQLGNNNAWAGAMQVVP